MGIFSRMTDIVNSNLNALLDKAEDPEKMIRLIIQEMEDTLVEVRSSSARLLADRKGAGRRRDRLREEVQAWEGKARLAIAKGREDLARAALQEKRLLEDELAAVDAELAAADGHIEQLSAEIGQLQAKLADAKAKQKAIALRGKAVASRIRVKRQIQREAVDDALSKFNHLERRMDRFEGQVEAMDLGREAPADLASQIDALEGDEKIDAELARIKREMGGGSQGAFQGSPHGASQGASASAPHGASQGAAASAPHGASQGTPAGAPHGASHGASQGASPGVSQGASQGARRNAE